LHAIVLRELLSQLASQARIGGVTETSRILLDRMAHIGRHPYLVTSKVGHAGRVEAVGLPFDHPDVLQARSHPEVFEVRFDVPIVPRGVNDPCGSTVFDGFRESPSCPIRAPPRRHPMLPYQQGVVRVDTLAPDHSPMLGEEYFQSVERSVAESRSMVWGLHDLSECSACSYVAFHAWPKGEYLPMDERIRKVIYFHECCYHGISNPGVRYQAESIQTCPWLFPGHPVPTLLSIELHFAGESERTC